MRKFIIGDIHGMIDKLKNCLDSVSFDYENDQLIQLGDIVDRGVNSFECVEELLKIKNLIAIRGNHDASFRDAILSGDLGNNILYNQGGGETRQSYYKNCHKGDNGDIVIPDSHIEFFLNTQKNYYIDEENNLFIHGGFDRHKYLKDQKEHVYYWDRDLFLSAISYSAMKDNKYSFKIKDGFSHIYVGHTPTTYWGEVMPITAADITNLDTGCGKGGLLTIMNLETKEFKQF